MALAIGFDVHRAQITFDALDEETGEVKTGRVVPADRPTLRRFLAGFAGQEVRAALEATTGWRFVCEELQRIAAEVHLAEPADTRARRGSKRRAKTDRLDARHLRELLLEGRLPESWIPPAHILELRSQVRLRHTLIDERTAWLQRVHAVLFHHGVPRPGRLAGRDVQERLAELDLPPSARRQVDVALAMVEQINGHVSTLDRELRSFARRQPGCRALMEHPGVGARVATAMLAELGDTRRFSSSRHAVRFAGLDVTVDQSDDKRRPGRLSRQGPPVLRWAAFEAAETACRPSSPDHEYYVKTKERLGANRACLSLARKLIRRAHHTLRELGDEALQPVV